MADSQCALSSAPEGATRDAMARFLSDMAHEMRGSLNVVTGFADLLHAEAYGTLNPEQRQAVADVMWAARKLRGMLDSVLDVVRIETGRLPLWPEVLSVRGAVELALADVSATARDRLVRLQADIPDDLAIWADELRTRQLLVQLLGNAVKYSPEGGAVTVSAETVGDCVRLAVSDEGPGIAPEHQEQVFEDFFSLDPPDSPEAGIGLGLPLARRLARVMDGDVRVTSAPAAGATFTVGLPRRDPPT
jgi:signal transduction histidine kinase